jgi:hypothetical protein
MKFTEWMNRKQTRLAIFDFDRTLANTKEKPADWGGEPGKPKPTGKDKSKISDWYEHPISLHGDNFTGLNPIVLNEFWKAKRDPNTHVAMITGRKGSISPLVRNILRSHGLYGRRVFPDRHPGNVFAPQHPKESHPHAHQEFYRGDFEREADYPKTPKGTIDSRTPIFKRYTTERLVTSDIMEIDIWEDNEENIAEFKKMIVYLAAKNPQLKRANIHWVTDTEIKNIALL